MRNRKTRKKKKNIFRSFLVRMMAEGSECSPPTRSMEHLLQEIKLQQQLAAAIALRTLFLVENNDWLRETGFLGSAHRHAPPHTEATACGEDVKDATPTHRPKRTRSLSPLTSSSSSSSSSSSPHRLHLAQTAVEALLTDTQKALPYLPLSSPRAPADLPTNGTAAVHEREKVGVDGPRGASSSSSVVVAVREDTMGPPSHAGNLHEWCAALSTDAPHFCVRLRTALHLLHGAVSRHDDDGTAEAKWGKGITSLLWLSSLFARDPMYRFIRRLTSSIATAPDFSFDAWTTPVCRGLSSPTPTDALHYSLAALSFLSQVVVAAAQNVLCRLVGLLQPMAMGVYETGPLACTVDARANPSEGGHVSDEASEAERRAAPLVEKEEWDTSTHSKKNTGGSVGSEGCGAPRMTWSVRGAVPLSVWAEVAPSLW